MSNLIEKIIYINLDQRQDRKVQIEDELEKYQLTAQRFKAIKHEEGIVGCGFSHLAVFKLAKKNGYKNILILEDDFMFLVSKEELENSLNRFFQEVGNNYDVCMLTNSNTEYNIPSKYPFLNKVYKSSNASAYIINGDYLDKLIDLYEYNIPLLEETRMHWIFANDVCWQKLQETDTWYVFNPRLGKQRAGYSDNAKSHMDYS